MRKVQEKKIGLASYKVQQFGALRGQNLLLRISAMVGPAIGRSASGDAGNLALGPFVEEFFAHFETDKVEAILSEFATGTQVFNGKGWSPLSDCYDEHFAGNYLELVQWFRFALEVNYSDFLSELQKRVGTNPDQTSAE